MKPWLWCETITDRRPKALRLLGLGLTALAVFFLNIAPAYAQVAIVTADPAANQSVSASPGQVRLTFDHPLIEQGTSISVNNAEGTQIDNHDGRIDPTNQFVLVVTLPELPEDQYTVNYVAASVGSSTTLAGSYQFTIDFPDPVITLVEPKSGQVFDPGPVPVEIQTQYIDFAADDSRVRVYVDGALYMEMRGLTGQITDLPPGVHELRLVLAQFGGREIPETSSTQYIVIARPDPELAGREAAAVAAPDPGLQLTPLELMGILLATAALLGIGLWLGRAQEKAG
jgi:methionine-rich copper-binding protein CopC